MRIATAFLLASCLAGSVAAQEAALPEPHAVPLASEGNRIELALANPSASTLEGVRVRVAEAPPWLVWEAREQAVGAIEGEQEGQAAFTFSVGEAAVGGEEGAVLFEILTGDRLVGERAFRLAVEAPQEVVLKRNYPNPFNPSTTIGFALPAASDVRLTIYDVLGRCVAVLADQPFAPGYHEAVWDASGVASGTYLYRLDVRAEGGSPAVKQGTMLLLK